MEQKQVQMKIGDALITYWEPSGLIIKIEDVNNE